MYNGASDLLSYIKETMDSVLANFIIMVIGASVGGCAAIIGATSACFMKSRCTSISSPCISCEREPLADDNPVYQQTMPPVT